MTRNQLAYLQQSELARANRAQELQTRKRDEANIELQKRQLAESHRHNVTLERQQRKSIRQNALFNVRQYDLNTAERQLKERLNAAQLDVTSRRDSATIALGVDRLAADRAYNLKSLEENRRRNLVNENLQMRSLFEQERSNRAREAEQRRSNLANEQLRLTQMGFALAGSAVNTGFRIYNLYGGKYNG